MAQSDHPLNRLGVASVVHILASGEVAHFTLQNISEFWNVATRPVAVNGLGLSIEFVNREVAEFEREMSLLTDKPEIYDEWRGLVVRHKVVGSKVHDAKLVAAMRVHGVERILTFNTDDFARYEVVAVPPSSLIT